MWHVQVVMFESTLGKKPVNVVISFLENASRYCGCPMGTTRDTGFTASTGHPSSNIDIEMHVPIGRPVGTTQDA